MNKILLFLVSICCMNSAQTYKAEKVIGSVKAQVGSSENWVEVRDNEVLTENTVIMTDKNSSVRFKYGDLHFTLNESSALSLSSIRKMSTDELLLALAMEEIINAPKNNNGDKSRSTAVYGTKTGEPQPPVNNYNFNDFGMKKINGAFQLAENGYRESAVITAKETFRKYPETKKLAFYRIYFADILYNCGLYAEAYDEFSEIKKLELTGQEKSAVDSKVNLISKKLTTY